MKKLIFASMLSIVVSGIGFGVSADESNEGLILSPGFEVLEHGGGCRKSSPAGQCCHKNHSTGVVHCH
jgi:hypothetical protein